MAAIEIGERGLVAVWTGFEVFLEFGERDQVFLSRVEGSDGFVEKVFWICCWIRAYAVLRKD